MLRKMIKIVGWSLLTLGVLLGFAVVSPRWGEPLTGSIRTVLVRVIAAAVSTSLDGTLHIGSLQGSLLKDPTLSGITLKDAQGETVASIGELRLRYSLRGLLQGHLDIEALEIREPTLNLVQEADGRLNLERVLSREPASTEDTPSSLTVKLDKLALRDGHISLRLPDLPGTQAIENITFELRGKIDPQGFRLQLQELTARTKPSNVVLKTVRGDVSQTADAIRFQDWLLQTAASNITLSGTFPIDLFASESGAEKPPAGKTKLQPGRQTPIAVGDSAHRGSHPSSASEPSSPAPIRAEQHSKPLHNAASQGAEPGPAPLPESTLTLALHPLDVAEIGRILGDPSLQGRLEGEITTAQIDDALNIKGRLAAGEGTLELDAKAIPKRQPARYHGSLTVSELDLSALVDKPGLGSSINLRLRVTGEGFEPAERRGRVQLAIERSQIGHIAIEPSEIRLKARRERFEVYAFDLNTSILKANLEGEIDLAGRSNLTYAPG